MVLDPSSRTWAGEVTQTGTHRACTELTWLSLSLALGTPLLLSPAGHLSHQAHLGLSPHCFRRKQHKAGAALVQEPSLARGNGLSAQTSAEEPHHPAHGAQTTPALLFHTSAGISGAPDPGAPFPTLCRLSGSCGDTWSSESSSSLQQLSSTAQPAYASDKWDSETW